MGSYNGDKSLRTSAQENLKFYQQEAGNEVETIIGYYNSLDNLKRLRASLNSGGLSSVEKQRLTSEYNELVREVNESTASLNEINALLNIERARQLDKWNRESEAFLQKFIN